jgi:fructose-bisphosphate aldolase, class I
MATRIDRVLRDKRALLLSFDQGLEEGPKAFNIHSIDPNYVLNIAVEGQYTGLVVQPGIAQKYIGEQHRSVPLIIKLNGKTAMNHINPLSRQYCSVERAIKLGAEAVGYTIYDGVPAESIMFQEFGHIAEQAHDYGIPVIAWMYPKDGRAEDTDTVAYAARVALELGADAVKVRYHGDKNGFDWVVKSAGRTKVFIADGAPQNDLALLQHVSDAVSAGATGAAFGKTVWQHPKPFSLTRALHAVIFKDKSPSEALKYLN